MNEPIARVNFNFVTVVLVLLVLSSANVKCNEDCTNLNIRNTVQNLYKLENCTVVTGYLAIVLLETSEPEDYEGIFFPELREITGFLIIYRAFGLKSVGQLFPNLVVIRGIQLFLNTYAFVIFDNEDIEELGLKSLIQIQRGFVRIQSNNKLCFTDTILWQNITKVTHPNIIDPVDATKCWNRSTRCIGCDPPACWSRQYCQRFDRPHNFTGINVTCHRNCLGGCYNDKTANKCFACRNITSDDGQCVDQCKPPTILNIDNNHCLHPDNCLKLGRIVFLDRCVEVCPPGYKLQNVNNDVTNTTTKTCVFCKPACPVTCNGTEVHSLDNARKLEGCTVINGTLMLRLNADGPDMDLLSDLERYLGEIVEITNFLKIYLSTALTTLSFLKNLRVIHGKMLENDKYGLIIYDNPNLKTLWNWTTKEQFWIRNGGMMIYHNHRLCLAEIQKFQSITIYSNVADVICRATNGNKQSCNVEHIFGQVKWFNSNNATVEWEPFISADPNYKLIGYTVSYIETSRTDITPQYGRDLCSKYGWQTVLLVADNIVKTDNLYQYTITSLRPYTQYGVYVTSFSAEEGNPKIIHGQTNIMYFITILEPPKIPIVGTASKTPNSIRIRWVIDENENNLIEEFKIFVWNNADIDFENQQQFCNDNKVKETNQVSSLDLLPCCMKKDEVLPYASLVEISIIYQTGLPICADVPSAQCHHLPYNPGKFSQSDSYYNYNNYYHNIDYEFRDSIFKYVGLNNLRSSVVHPGLLYNYTLKNVHRDYNITNLRPFGMYKFIVAACNNFSGCSPFYLHTDRTEPLHSNDYITFDLTNTSDSIYLYFKPPPNPNGITVAFHVNCLIITEQRLEGTICVTRKEHEEKNFTFTFHDLPNGSYAIRVRSISLAGYGAFTPWKFFDVYESVSDTKLQHTLTFVFIAILIIIILALVYKYYLARRCFKPNSAVADRVNLISMEYKPAEEETTWHLNYDSDDSEFSGFSGFNWSTSVEDPEPGTSNPFSSSPSTAHTEHERA